MGSSGSGPTVRKRQLGAELRRLRRAVGLTIEDAAARIECSTTKISRVETGQAPIKGRDVRDLLTLYGVEDTQQVERVMEIHHGAQQRGWWDQYDDVLPSGMSTYAGLESDAVDLRTYDPLIVNGLFQTGEYARAMISVTRPDRRSEIDRLVEFRMQRQKLLERTRGPLGVWAIFEESALRRPVGGTELMRDQLRHLCEVSEMPNITMQIMPNKKGAHPGLNGGFTLLRFDQLTPTGVYVETAAGNIYLQKDADAREFASTFDQLRAAASDPKKTITMLEGIAKEMEST